MEKPAELIKKSNFWANLFKEPTGKGEIQNVLAAMPPFSQLGGKHLKLLIQIIHNRAYTEGEYIFYQGDPGVALYIIIEGEVKIFQTDKDGQKNDLVHLNRGDFFGELALIDSDVRSASAIAETDANMAVIFKPDLDQFITQHPKKGIDILKGFAKIIATRLRSVNEDYMKLLKN